jgi:ssDNA-binding Zn-finger/Zn-ribbon topoisomerase 1
MPIHPTSQQQHSIDAVEINIQCPKCGKKHKIPGYMDITSIQIKNLNLKTNLNVKDNDILECDKCNYALDLKPIKNQMESQTKRKVTFR